MSPKTIIIPHSNHLKKRATIFVAKRLNEVVDMSLLYDLIGAAIENKSSDEDVLECLKRIDLTRIMKDSPGENKRFVCSFFIERKAWIFQDKKGHYRYYSRKEAGVFSFDIIDLLEVFRNESRKEVMTFIQQNWNLKGLTGWYLEQKEKYQSNEWILHKIQQEPETYPYLQKIINKYWIAIEKLNDFAMEKLMGKELSVDSQAIFFLSNNYFLEQHFPKRSISTINNLVNLFCILGFIKKVPFEKIPKELSDKAIVHHKRKGVRNHTSYYWMADFREIYEEAERRAKILINSDIYYHRLNKQVVKELFGEEFAEEIYVQRTYGNKAKLEPVYIKGQDTFYTESERLEEKFLQEIKATGKCAKSTLSKSSLLPRRRFDNTWKKLLKKYQCEEKYPTKEEIEHYQIEKRLLIAVPKEDRFVGSFH